MKEFARTLYPRLLAFTFGCAFLTYLFPLTHFSLNIDGESESNFEHTISLGRWSHAILRAFFLPEPFIPAFTLLLGLFSLSVAAVFVCRIVPLKGVAAVIFCAIFVSFPQMAYQFQFLNQADTIGIGYLLAVTSLYLIDGRDKNSIGRRVRPILAILSLSAAVSIYQTLALVPLTLLGGILAIRHSTSPLRLDEFVTPFLRTCLVTVLAVITSFLIGRLFIRYIGRSNDEYLLQSAFSLERSIEDFPENLSLVAEILRGGGHSGFELYAGAVIASSLLVTIFVQRSGAKAWPAVFAVLLSLLIPLCIIFVSSGGLPARTYVAMNSSLAVLLAAITPWIGTFVSSSLAFIAVMIGLGSVSTFFVSDYLVRQADIRIGTRIADDIAKLYPNAPNSVYFYGAREPHRNVHTAQHDTFGTSFWAWDGGNTQRIVPFLSFYDIVQLEVANDASIRHADPYARSMPIWPQPGSIQVIGDTLVVRLGKNRGYLPFDL